MTDTAYATLTDVQALINSNWFLIESDSEPDETQVQVWLTQYALQVDTAAGLASESSNPRDVLLIGPYLAGRVAFDVVSIVKAGKNITPLQQSWFDQWDAWIAALTKGDQRLPSVAGSTGRARMIPTSVYGLDS